MGRLDRLLSHLPPPVRAERVLAFNTLVINVLAGREGTPPTRSGDIPIPVLVADLVDMAAGLLSAPVSAITHLELDLLEPEPS